MRCILLISNVTETNSSNKSTKAAYLTFHPERNNILPRIHELLQYSWTWLNTIRDFGIIYVPPRVKRKYHKQNGYLYIIGGYDGVKKKVRRNIQRYDFVRGEWWQCCKLETRRMSFTPFLYDGRIYCAGGYTGKHTITDSVEYYEPTMDHVYQAPPLPKPSANYSSVFHTRSRSVYLIGGQIQGRNGIVRLSNHFWMFSLVKVQTKSEDNNGDDFVSEDKWIDMKEAYLPVPDGIIGHKAVISESGDRIYVIGGSSTQTVNSQLEGLYYLNTLQLQIYKSNYQQQHSQQPPQINWCKRGIRETQKSNPAVVLIENKIFIIGGTDNKFNSTVTIAEVSEDEDKIESPSIQPQKMSSSNQNRALTFCPTNQVVGYYDWKRKMYQEVFRISETTNSTSDDTDGKDTEGIKLEHLHGVVVELDERYEEFGDDRLNWMLQWPVW